jgi:hypothetical protein
VAERDMAQTYEPVNGIGVWVDGGIHIITSDPHGDPVEMSAISRESYIPQSGPSMPQPHGSKTQLKAVYGQRQLSNAFPSKLPVAKPPITAVRRQIGRDGSYRPNDRRSAVPPLIPKPDVRSDAP